MIDFSITYFLRQVLIGVLRLSGLQLGNGFTGVQLKYKIP